MCFLYRTGTEEVARFLSKNGLSATGISSLLPQKKREVILKKFKTAAEDINILVATDVAARGLDIKGVDMVINYDLPDDSETYVHRIGRTGRSGASGYALSLSSVSDVAALGRIESLLRMKIPVQWLEDEDLLTEFKSFERNFHEKRSGIIKNEFQKKKHSASSKKRSSSSSGKPSSKRRSEQRSGANTSFKKKKGSAHALKSSSSSVNVNKFKQKKKSPSYSQEKKKKVSSKFSQTNSSKTVQKRHFSRSDSVISRTSTQPSKLKTFLFRLIGK